MQTGLCLTILIMCTQCTPFNTFYMQCISGVRIIIWLKKMTIIKLCFIFSHLMFYCYLFFKIATFIVFFLLINSVLCIWLSNEGIKHKFHLSLHFWKLNFFFFANKGNLLLQLKHVVNVVWSFLKKINNNFSSSSVMYILLNKYFCCTVFKKTFILTGCREYLYISMCIWYEDSFTQMKQ